MGAFLVACAVLVVLALAFAYLIGGLLAALVFAVVFVSLWLLAKGAWWISAIRQSTWNNTTIKIVPFSNKNGESQVTR
jgi:hypothetical protein